MKKRMKKITALLLVAVMIMGVVVNSDVVKNYASGETANAIVDVMLDTGTANGGNANGIYVKPSRTDEFYYGSWEEDSKPKAATGGVYVDGELIVGCRIVKCPWSYYYIDLSAGTITAVEGTEVVLDGIYERSDTDPQKSTDPNYTVKFNKATFRYNGGSWQQIFEEEKEPDQVDATVDVTFALAADGGLWLNPSSGDDFYTKEGETDWAATQTSVTGGVYVNGNLNKQCSLKKFSWGQYWIDLNQVQITQGMTVVIDGIYGRWNNEFGNDPACGDDYKVKFNKATFEYTGDGWEQIYETDINPTERTESHLIWGDNPACISLWADKNDLPGSTPDQGGTISKRIAGGIYVDGVLNADCMLIKFTETNDAQSYMITWADGKVDVKEGTTIVLDGIYGDENYSVKFDKATFQYTKEGWTQLYTVDVSADNPNDSDVGIYVHTNAPDGLLAEKVWAEIYNPYSGGIYVNDVLQEGNFIQKLEIRTYNAQYFISLGSLQATDGMRVVIDGLFGNDEREGGMKGLRLKVNRATFVYDGANATWHQLRNGELSSSGTFGDANADNRILDVTDFVRMLRYTAADEVNINLTDADLNKDNQVDTRDIQLTKEILTGKTVFSERGYNVIGKPSYDGTEQLPIGAYAGPRRGTEANPTDYRTEEQFKTYADAGFNTVIAEYDVEYGTNYDAAGNATAVKNFAGSDLENYMRLAKKYDIDVFVESSKLKSVLGGKATVENAEAELTTMLSALQGMDNFKGILMGDEPWYDAILNYQRAAELFHTKKAMQDKKLFVSLLPYNIDKKALLGNYYYEGDGTNKWDDQYREYLRGFGSCLGVVNTDFYPFGQLVTEKTMQKDYFKCLEMTAEAAKEVGEGGVTIQSFASRDSDGNIWLRELNDKKYYTYQLYSALAYGMKNVNYFTYWEHWNANYEGSVMYNNVINANGTVNETVYNAVKAANEEILKFDQVYMDFNWSGTMKAAGKDSDQLLAQMSDYKNARVDSFTADQDTIMGCLKDSNGYDGFMLVNATDPEDNLTSNVSVTFQDAQKAIVYVEGVEQEVTLTNGTYTTTLAPGAGVFVIPYCEGTEESEMQADKTVNIALVPGTEAGSFWIHPDTPDDFYPNAGQEAIVSPQAVIGGIYVNGELNSECKLEKYAWGDYQLVLNAPATEGTTVVLDGVYGRGSDDTQSGDNYTVRFNKAVFQYINGSWQQLPVAAEVKANLSVDVVNVNGGDTACIWIATSPEDEFYLFYTDDDWAKTQTPVTGGIYVDGILNNNCVLKKFVGQYYIDLAAGGVTVEEGTTVVLNGTYGRWSGDPKYGDDYKVKFNRTVFVYKGGSWVQCGN